jgi:FlaA1/EpsC-like NDP-sugar epimerase
MKLASYDPYSALNQKLIDALIAGLSLCASYELRFDSHIPAASTYQIWVLLVPVMLGRVLVNFLLGTYRMVWRYISLSDAITLARNQLAFSLLAIAIRYGTGPRFEVLQVPVSVIVLDMLLFLVGSLAVRALRRVLSEELWNHARGTPVLLAGAGRAGVIVARELKSRSDIRPLGFLDDDPKKNGAVICGLRVLGPLKALGLSIQQHRAQEVIVCLPRAPRDTLKRIWAVCEQLGVRVRIVPTLDEVLSGKISIASFRDVEMKDLLGRDAVEISAENNHVAETYFDKCILVTGAGGSIGSELACQLEKLKPKQLVLLDKDENGLHDVYLRLQKEGNGIATPVVADIRFPHRIRSIFVDYMPEVIFHAAAHKHVHLMEENPCEAIQNNVVGTRTLVETALEFGVSRFVQISTDKAVNPTSIMGASKRVCEMIVQSTPEQGRMRFCCVRFGNVLGSRGSVVPIFQEQIARGGPVRITHRSAQRFLMTIPEAVCLLIQAGTLAQTGEIFVLDMGEPVFIEHLARNLIEHMGLRPGKDVPLEITELHPGEKLSEMLVDDATEALEPTPFAKISMIRSEHFDRRDFDQKLAYLEQASSRGAAEEVYEALRDLNIGFQASTKDEQFMKPLAQSSRAVGA